MDIFKKIMTITVGSLFVGYISGWVAGLIWVGSGIWLWTIDDLI